MDQPGCSVTLSALLCVSLLMTVACSTEACASRMAVDNALRRPSQSKRESSAPRPWPAKTSMAFAKPSTIHLMAYTKLTKGSHQRANVACPYGYGHNDISPTHHYTSLANLMSVCEIYPSSSKFVVVSELCSCHSNFLQLPLNMNC